MSNAGTSLIETKRKNEREILDVLYTSMPVGEEITTGAGVIAQYAGISYSQMNSIAREFESLGILNRRSTWSGGGGKQVLWKLNMPKADAVLMLEEFQTSLSATHSDGNKHSLSLKTRILNAIKEEGSFNTVEEILNIIRQPNENIDLHNMTHCLYVLRTQGKITFKTDSHGKNQKRKSNDSIPVGIMYTETAPRSYKRSNSSPEAIVQPTVSVPTPEPVVTEAIISAPAAFPLIRTLVNRRATLEAAAALAEQAGEDEMALNLLEKAQMKTSDFNEEVVALWSAYQACKES